MRWLRLISASAVLLSFGPSVRGQGPAALPDPPEFAVASVKPHTSDDQGRSMVAQPGGRFVAVNTPLRMLIRTAYQVQDDQIVDAPAWVDSERFDIDARADAPGPPRANLVPRLQALLAQRFNLMVHHDTRELPVYALVRAKGDGPLGAGLRVTECPEIAQDLSGPRPCTHLSTGLGTLTARGMPFDQFLPYLAVQLNRVVLDRTGLTGRYDVDLKWTPDRRGAAIGPDAPSADPNAISIFTALQEQLGLKLDSTRAPVDVLVIDRVERPSPN